MQVAAAAAFTAQQGRLEQVVLAAEEMQTDRHQQEATVQPTLEAAVVAHQEMGL
jgi:hypothetical protein